MGGARKRVRVDATFLNIAQKSKHIGRPMGPIPFLKTGMVKGMNSRNRLRGGFGDRSFLLRWTHRSTSDYIRT